MDRGRNVGVHQVGDALLEAVLPGAIVPLGQLVVSALKQ